MTSTDENIRLLSNAVLSDVRGDADRLLTEAREKAEEIRRRARERAAAERARILEQANAEAGRVREQSSASAHLRARTLQLDQREQLLNSVFEAAKQRLAVAQKSSDYEATARLLLREAVVQLGANPVRVRADEGTRKHLTASVLAAAEKDLKLKIEMGEPLSGVSGVIAETPDGRRQFDNTLESRLARMRPALRAAVHRILMGEAR